MILPREQHQHEALYFRTISLDDGTRVVETCRCGAERSTERREHRVEWSPWVGGR